MSGSHKGLRPPGTVSYLAGPTAEPLAYLTIPGLLDQACERWGARDAMGRAKYGTPLRVHNGRAPLVDALQEALDLMV